MTGFETITLDCDSRGVARLTLNRPERHNAINSAMIAELTEAVRRVASDAAVRVVLLSALGKSFCAGADLGWMRQQFAASPDNRSAEAARFAAMLRAIDELPQFVVGVIEGAAYGGGVGLAAVCDVVIAGPAARFALSETRLGIIPATIAPYLHRRIGTAGLRRLALHGEAFGAADALAIGLVSQTAAAEDVATAANRHVELALACAPGAIAEAKLLFRRIAAGEAGERETIAALTRRWDSEEARTGIAAFFNKAKPPWRP